MAPCYVVLDGLDTVLGTSRGGDDGDEDGADGGNEAGRRTRGERTSHKAIDRLLSSLLVEIDGIGDNYKTIGTNSEPRPVVVIATASSLSGLDRLAKCLMA